MAPEPLRRFRSGSVEATEALGEALGRRLAAGAVVALEGDLGAGKTAFVRGLARGLGVEDVPTSPTFTLMQEHAGRLPFLHFDAWMAGREALFLEGGGAEYLGGEGVAAVEWAERVAAYLPRPHLRVRILHTDPATRHVELLLVGAEEQDALEEPAERLLGALEGLRAPAGAVELSPDPGEPGARPGVGRTQRAAPADPTAPSGSPGPRD